MTKKQKHLTLEDRIDIQTGISQQETFRSIAEKMGKDHLLLISDPLFLQQRQVKV